MKNRRRRSIPGVDQTQCVASATECTGLMPALPKDEAQDESEAALYGIHDAVDSCPGK